MKFTKATLVASAAAMSLGLAACDGPTEEAMEDTGEQMESELDAQAEAMEDKADAVEDTMEEQADTVGEEMDGNEM